jgi:GxxExxY protein
MSLNELSFAVRGCIFEVFKELGPGLLESVYQHALFYELRKNNLNVRAQVGLPVKYKEVELDLGFRIDLLVEEKLLIEIKSVEALHDVHKKQLLTYLKLGKKSLGLLVNFNVAVLQDKISLVRIINS